MGQSIRRVLFSPVLPLFSHALLLPQLLLSLSLSQSKQGKGKGKGYLHKGKGGKGESLFALLNWFGPRVSSSDSD